MSKSHAIFERFQTETIKEFKKENFNTSIERVKDTMLRKTWYNVIWCNRPTSITLVNEMLKFMYTIKSKSYKNKKDAIEHFKEIIKSQLYYD